MRVLPWTRSHAPKRAADVAGQERAVARVRAYVESFRPGQKPLLLHGPPGTGKTVTVYAVAQDLDREVVEVNASDTRNKASINELLGAALHQQSLFFKGKVVLVDEADGLSGRSDRGGVQALLALLKDARHPVVVTANDAQADKLKALRKAAELVEFQPLPPATLKELLLAIAKKENVVVDDQAVAALARRSGGDARAAINDLQTLTGDGALTREDLDALGDREHKEQLQQALTRVFKTTSAEVALPAFDNVDENVDELFLWVEENVAREYTKPADLARALDALAEADRFFGRIRRWQYYRFYVYIYNLLSAGIALAKEEKYPGAQTYKRSSKLLSIWMANQRNAKKKSIAAKVGAATHTSTRRALQDTVPFLRPMFENGALADALAEELDLSDEEAAWLER